MPTEPPEPTPPPPRRRLGRLFALLLVALALAFWRGLITLPPRFDPFAPLDVSAAPNGLTGLKLSRARSDPARCEAALVASGAGFQPEPDRAPIDGCGWTGAVRLRQAGARLAPPVLLSCPMALSFVMWERHTLQPAAQLYFGQSVTAVDNLGSYACRNVNLGKGRSGARRSRHATANAMDVAGLTLGNGTRVSVLRDWAAAAGAGGPDAALLRDAHEGACRWFDGVLGPAYNAAHRNHFHLEAGGWHTCR